MHVATSHSPVRKAAGSSSPSTAPFSSPARTTFFSPSRRTPAPTSSPSSSSERPPLPPTPTPEGDPGRRRCAPSSRPFPDTPDADADVDSGSGSDFEPNYDREKRPRVYRRKHRVEGWNKICEDRQRARETDRVWDTLVQKSKGRDDDGKGPPAAVRPKDENGNLDGEEDGDDERTQLRIFGTEVSRNTRTPFFSSLVDPATKRKTTTPSTFYGLSTISTTSLSSKRFQTPRGQFQGVASSYPRSAFAGLENHPGARKRLIVSKHLDERREKVEEEEVSSSTEIILSPEKVGFENRGNTCYINSVFQCLLGIPMFVRDVEAFTKDMPEHHPDLDGEKGGKFELVKLLSTVIRHRMQRTSVKKLKAPMDNFKTTFETFFPSFKGVRHQDAHEFMIQLFSKINDEAEALTKVQKDVLSPVKSNFEFHLTEVKICQRCQHKSERKTQDTLFRVTNLWTPSKEVVTHTKSLSDLVKKTLHNQIEMACEKCSKEVEIETEIDGEKQNSQVMEKTMHDLSERFHQLPPVLVIFLPRIDFARESMRVSKKKDPVRIPLVMSLTDVANTNGNDDLLKAIDAKRLHQLQLSSPGRGVGLLKLNPIEDSPDLPERPESPFFEVNKVLESRKLMDSNVTKESGYRRVNQDTLCTDEKLEEGRLSTTPTVIRLSAKELQKLSEDEQLEYALKVSSEADLSSGHQSEEQQMEYAMKLSLLSEEEQQYELALKASIATEEPNSAEQNLPQVDQDELGNQNDIANLDENDVKNTRLLPLEEKKLSFDELFDGSKPTNSNVLHEYRWIGVVNHLGESTRSGHYVASVYSFKKQKWFHYNDDLATESNLKGIIKESATNGYLYFYAHEAYLSQQPLDEPLKGDCDELKKNIL